MPGITVASVTAASVRRGTRERRDHAPPRLPQQLAGCILWLPPKAEIPGDHESDLEADRCNHPVVVLSPQFVDGKVTYLTVRPPDTRDTWAYCLRLPTWVPTTYLLLTDIDYIGIIPPGP